MGPYVGVDYNSPYLIVNSVVSFTPQLQFKGNGEDLSYWLGIFCLCLLISKTGKHKYREGGGKG
jgi:hypothetical protein